MSGRIKKGEYTAHSALVTRIKQERRGEEEEYRLKREGRIRVKLKRKAQKD